MSIGYEGRFPHSYYLGLHANPFFVSKSYKAVAFLDVLRAQRIDYDHISFLLGFAIFGFHRVFSL